MLMITALRLNDKNVKYYKYGHEKWIREDKGEEILKAMVDWRLRQMMGFFYDLA